MIGLILAVTWILMFFVFSCVLFPIEWIVGKISPRAKDISMLRILQGFFKIGMFLTRAKLKVEGFEKIPKEGPVLYVMNHRSIFDVVAVLSVVPDVTGFVSKKEWKKVPLLSWWIVAMHGFYLDRENIRSGFKTILEIIEKVKGGLSVAIFPEGTRNRNPQKDNMLPFHEGSFKIAERSGCVIVPTVICHRLPVYEEHVPWVHPMDMLVVFMDPISMDGLSKDEKKFIGRYIRGQMQEVLTAGCGGSGAPREEMNG